MNPRILSILPALMLGFSAVASAQPGRLDFLKAHDSSFAMLANTSATFQTRKFPNEVLLISGLPFAPTVAAHVDLGLGDPHCMPAEPCGRLRNMAISPDGDTALVSSDPSDALGPDRDVSALVLLRNIRAFARSKNKADLRIRVFKATDFPQLDNVSGIAFGPGGRWAVVSTAGPGPVDVTYTHARGTLVVVTGLPDTPRFSRPFAVPMHSQGNISLSLDGGTLLLNDTSDLSTGVLRSNQIIVQGIQPGGGSPRVVATSSFALPSGVTDIITPVRDAKLTLDGRFVIAPVSILSSFDANGQPVGYNQLEILGPIRRGNLDARILKESDGVKGGPFYAAIHPDGNTALIVNNLDLGGGELLTQLATGNPSKFAIKPLPFPFFGPALFPLGPFGPPVLASHAAVVFTPDGKTALVDNWVIPPLADSSAVPSVSVLTGFDTGNIQVAANLLDPILNTFDNNQQIATVPSGLLDYVRLYVPAGSSRDHLTSLVDQAIAASDRGDFSGSVVAPLVRFIFATAGLRLQGALTSAQTTTLNTLATIGIQTVIGSEFELSSDDFSRGQVAPEAMASLRGLTPRGADRQISVIDSDGIERRATVREESHRRLDYVVPGGTAIGKAVLLVVDGGAVSAAAMIDVEPVLSAWQ